MSQARNTVNIANKLFASWSSQTSMEMQTSKMERIDSEVLGSQLWKHLMGLELKHGVFKLTASSETNVLPPLRYQPRPLSSRTPLECCCPWLCQWPLPLVHLEPSSPWICSRASAPRLAIKNCVFLFFDSYDLAQSPAQSRHWTKMCWKRWINEASWG